MTYEFEVLACDSYSTEAGEERWRPAVGAKPRMVRACDADEAIEKAGPFFRMPHDFIHVSEPR